MWFDFLRQRDRSETIVSDSSLKVHKDFRVTHIMKVNQALPTSTIASSEPKADLSFLFHTVCPDPLDRKQCLFSQRLSDAELTLLL